MKQEFSEDSTDQDSYDVIQNTLHTLDTSLPRLVIDIQTLKGSVVKQVTQFFYFIDKKENHAYFCSFAM